MICINVFDLDCSCNLTGTGGDENCSGLTGQCSCITGFTGLKCDECAVGYTGGPGGDCSICISGYYAGDSGCVQCGCNLSGTIGGSSSCQFLSGSVTCSCAEGYSGNKCDECSLAYYLTGSTCNGKFKIWVQLFRLVKLVQLTS